MAKAFGGTSTTDEVLEGVSLSGKRVLVTGVSAGLGVETARSLAAHGAEVVGAARDLAKAKAATVEVRAGAANGGGLDLVELDLASLASVRDCADALIAEGARFDLVIANAGVMACPFGKTADGFETQFGTNHLGHFVLVNRIAALMNPKSRLVNLSSAGHRYSDVDLDDPNFDRTPYDPWIGLRPFEDRQCPLRSRIRPPAQGERRGRDRRPPRRNSDRAFAPSYARGGTGADRPDQRRQSRDRRAGLRFKSIPQGAATSVWAGVVASADEVGGRYCEDCHVAEIEPNPDNRAGVKPYALDPERAKALWAKSEEMVGERF